MLIALLPKLLPLDRRQWIQVGDGAKGAHIGEPLTKQGSSAVIVSSILLVDHALIGSSQYVS
eukprot:10676267-Karenia_brevis.AAC.1